MTGLNNLGDVRLIELPRYAREDGQVVVAQFEHVPFAIARMFTLTAPAGAVRGKHAHRAGWQFMLCVHGIVGVTCDDGREQRTFSLDCDNRALLVPPTIWNIVTAVTDNAVLVVLCDRLYEEHDYIRDYAEFMKFRKARA